MNSEKIISYKSTIKACVIVAISPINIISIIACGACGIFVSLLWPGTLVVASDKLPLAGASMFALLAAAGDVGAAVGPWAMGKITDVVTVIMPHLSSGTMNSEQLGLRIAMLIAAIFPIITMILHKVLKSVKDK